MTIIGLRATLPQVITAIGGLGTAAFGLVDASKAFGGSVNHFGFQGIKAAVTALAPDRTVAGPPANALSQQKMLATLQANWFNGTDLASQKSIAKSLIKLNLNPGNAVALAGATGVDVERLVEVEAARLGRLALAPVLAEQQPPRQSQLGPNSATSRSRYCGSSGSGEAIRCHARQNRGTRAWA